MGEKIVPRAKVDIAVTVVDFTVGVGLVGLIFVLVDVNLAIFQRFRVVVTWYENFE